MFDFISIISIYLVFFRKKIHAIKKLYSLKKISLLPIVIIFAIIVMLFRVASINGINDIQLLLKIFNIETLRLIDSDFFANFFATFITPVWEEFLFRGVIFIILLRKFGLKIAIILPSIIFALLHFDPLALNNISGFFISTILLLFFESVVKSFLFYKTKSLTLPTLMHITSNIVAMIIEVAYFQLGY